MTVRASLLAQNIFIILFTLGQRGTFDPISGEFGVENYPLTEEHLGIASTTHLMKTVPKNSYYMTPKEEADEERRTRGRTYYNRQEFDPKPLQDRISVPAVRKEVWVRGMAW